MIVTAAAAVVLAAPARGQSFHESVLTGGKGQDPQDEHSAADLPAIVTPDAVGTLASGAPSSREGRWYGEAMLLLDMVSIGTIVAMLAAAENEPQPTGYVSPVHAWPLATYELAGPVVHATESRFRGALASAGLRIAVPFAGLLIGAVVDGCADKSRSPACDVGPAAGLVLGLALATMVDVEVIARHRGAPAETLPSECGLAGPAARR